MAVLLRALFTEAAVTLAHSSDEEEVMEGLLLELEKEERLSCRKFLLASSYGSAGRKVVSISLRTVTEIGALRSNSRKGGTVR